MKKVIIILAVLVGFESFGQQIPLSSLYTYNTFAINPAAAGIEKDPNIYMGQRLQWVGFEGAPTTTWLNGYGRINNKIGIGGSFALDKMAFVERLSASASFAYHLKLNRDAKLHFGLSLGMIQGKIALDGVIADDMNDELLLNPTLRGIGFDAQFGALFVYKKVLKVGFSLPQMFSNSVNLDLANIQGAYDLSRHTIFHVSYTTDMSDDIKFVPTFLWRNAGKATSQIDFMGNINFKEQYWGGLGFRQEGGFLVNAGIRFQERYALTYAYEFANKGISSGTGGSHELMIHIILKPKPDPEAEEEDMGEKEEMDEEIEKRKVPTKF